MGKAVLLATVLTLSLAAAAQQQPDWEAVEIKVHKVAGQVYMLEGRGGNIGVSVGEDGIVIVDDQYAPLAAKIKQALSSITDKPVKFVLNTHWHGDHTGGNEVFGETAPIIAHTNVRERLRRGGIIRGNKVAAAKKGALPVITFDDRLTVHLNGEDIRAIHFPHGHTDGDAVIYFTRSNVIHMGDNFFVGRFPFIDLDSGGSVRGLLANCEKVLRDLPADARIIPGHGPVSSRADLETYVNMLRDTIGAVEKAIQQGRTLEELKAENPFAKYKDWGSGFVNAEFYLETLYKDLSKKK